MTSPTRSAAQVRAPLTELENEIMQVVWDAGPCPVEALHQVVSRKRKRKETSVRAILRRLEQKGYLRPRGKRPGLHLSGSRGIPQSGSPRRAANHRPPVQGSVEELVSRHL